MRQIKITTAIRTDDSCFQKYISDIKQLKAFNFTDEDEGDLTSDELVEKNIRFAISIARKFLGRGVPEADLIQAANIGLVIASKKFDPTKGIKFISYAIFWITQQIEQEITNNGKIVHVPCNLYRKIGHYKNDLNKFIQENEFIPEGEGSSILESENPLKAVLQFSRIKSLDDQLSRSTDDTCNCTVGDMIPGTFTSDELTNSADMEINIKHLFSKLEPNERKVITEVIFNDKTLAEVADEFGLSIERIRQIKVKALLKLKNIIKKNKKCL